MPSLLDVQRGFRTAVLAADASLPPSLINGGTVSAAARLGVYRNNVIGNLTRALRLSFPAVDRLVGEDFFAAAAQRFIEASPPHAADLNQYGEDFAESAEHDGISYEELLQKILNLGLSYRPDHRG